ncbi:class I SAM-dependent methyltransferase [Brachybacterium hainanense]|uniref:Class I SAM-dependent methyltransferase n=1 Tax=Brachybacterium hainanense TaxID=1541174 RepID=A0ABV6R7L1_9MICO
MHQHQEGPAPAEDRRSAAHDAAVPAADPAQHWEEHYAGTGPVWSGEVNASLAAVLADLVPAAPADGAAPRALDLGCGEGADAIWLARAGWVTTGVDISPTAIARARQAAAAADVDPSRLLLLSADLSDEAADATLGGPFDLVTAAFFHASVALPRRGILRRAAALLAPGGRLLVLSHAALPPWAAADPSAHDHEHDTAHGDGSPGMSMRSPQEDLEDLALPAEDFEVERVEVLRRAATAPDGTPAELEDGILLLRRR